MSSARRERRVRLTPVRVYVTNGRILVAGGKDDSLLSSNVRGLRCQKDGAMHAAFFSADFKRDGLHVVRFISFGPPSIVIRPAMSRYRFPTFALIHSTREWCSRRLVSSVTCAIPNTSSIYVATSPIHVPVEGGKLQGVCRPPTFYRHPTADLCVTTSELPNGPYPNGFLRAILKVTTKRVRRVHLLQGDPILLQVRRDSHTRATRGVRVLHVRRKGKLFITHCQSVRLPQL